tara:strand:+ start:654 stop:950 length:297 start_codon:yes stop_codon:yes gene_type:complete
MEAPTQTYKTPASQRKANKTYYDKTKLCPIKTQARRDKQNADYEKFKEVKIARSKEYNLKNKEKIDSKRRAKIQEKKDLELEKFKEKIILDFLNMELK